MEVRQPLTSIHQIARNYGSCSRYSNRECGSREACRQQRGPACRPLCDHPHPDPGNYGHHQRVPDHHDRQHGRLCRYDHAGGDPGPCHPDHRQQPIRAPDGSGRPCQADPGYDRVRGGARGLECTHRCAELPIPVERLDPPAGSCEEHDQ